MSVFGYEDGCILTFGQWSENPWAEEHVVYEMYNDLDLSCMYLSEDDYETCFAFFRVEDAETPTWEFAEGGAWIWTDCGYGYDDSWQWNCYNGEWDVTRSDFEYDWSEMESKWDSESYSYSGWDDSYYSWGDSYYSWDDSYYSWGSMSGSYYSWDYDYYSWGDSSYAWESYYYWGDYYDSMSMSYWSDDYYYGGRGGRGGKKDKGKRRMGALRNVLSAVSLGAIAYASI